MKTVNYFVALSEILPQSLNTQQASHCSLQHVCKIIIFNYYL